MQTLLNICFSSGSELNILFNQSKCIIMMFKTETYRNCVVPTFRLDLHKLYECMSFKYGILYTTLAQVTRISPDNVAAFTQKEIRLSDITINVPILWRWPYSNFTAQIYILQSNYTQIALCKLTVVQHIILSWKFVGLSAKYVQ